MEAVKKAAEVAARGKLVLFGITPTEAHTGYGYIRQGAPLEGSNGSAFAIAGFRRETGPSYRREIHRSRRISLEQWDIRDERGDLH